MQPHVAVFYFEEEQASYVDSSSAIVPGQDVTLGRLTFGPRFSTVIYGPNGTNASPFLALTGLWDFADTETVNLTTGLSSVSSDEFRARRAGGVAWDLTDGVQVQGDGFYDGIGTDELEAYGGSIAVRLRLN